MPPLSLGASPCLEGTPGAVCRQPTLQSSSRQCQCVQSVPERVLSQLSAQQGSGQGTATTRGEGTSWLQSAVMSESQEP